MPTRPAPPLALHVTLRWGDDVLAFRRLEGRGVAHVDAFAPIPCSPALEGFVFARLAERAATALVPAGLTATVWRADGAVELVAGPAAIALGAGDTAELAIGEFRLAATADPPEASPRGRHRRPAGAWGAVAAAALAHAVVLGLAAQDARAWGADALDDERTRTLKGLLASAELREQAKEAQVLDGTGAGEGRLANEKRGDGRPGGGAKAAGDDGAMGDRLGRAGDRRRYAVPERSKKDPEPSAARAEALADAAQFGMIGLIGQGPPVPSAPFADDFAHGADALAANGALWARLVGQSGGTEGLGLTGIGEGGGGRGEGIGLGTVGTLGHAGGRAGPGTGGEGSARRRWGGSHRVRVPYCRFCYGQVSGRLPAEIVQRTVRQSFGRFRACYEAGLQHTPELQGRVSVRFVIGRDGAVSSVGDAGSDLPDGGVTSCVVRAFGGLSFPQPEGGIVTVVYPIAFAPG